MDFENLLNDAVEYTRETFAGHWVRWLIFVVLGLPLSLMRFVIRPEALIDRAGFHPELIPWGPLAALIIAGFLGSLFIGGYSVRVYRGTRPAPDFTGWGSLFLDGIKLDIVMLVWFLPALAVLLAEVALGLGMFLTRGSAGNLALFPLMILLLPVELILIIVAVLFMIPGAVRFARTGSMAEGWRFSALRGILGRIGWGNYLIALILYIVIAVLYSLAVSVPAAIPYVGWIIPVCLTPFLTIFSARYFTFVYETGEVPPGGPTAGSPESVAP